MILGLDQTTAGEPQHTTTIGKVSMLLHIHVLLIAKIKKN